MLVWRVITAIILIPIVLSGIFILKPFWFSVAAGGIFLLGAMEWAKLCLFKNRLQTLILVFILGLLFLAAALKAHIGLLWVGTLFWLMPLYWTLQYRGEAIPFLNSPWVKAIIGCFYLVCAYFALVQLHLLPNGPWWILFLFLLIWSSDTFAYFMGRWCGKHLMAPYVSPKKTLEGLAGGVLGAMLVAGAISYFIVNYITPAVPIFTWYLIALVTVCLGVLGDLFESLMKRLANVKDSGHLLPGHGGVLDRIDSLVAALPFYTLGLTLALVR